MSISYEPEQRYLNPLLFCLSALEGQFYNLVYYWKLSHVDVVKGGNIYLVLCELLCTKYIYPAIWSCGQKKSMSLFSNEFIDNIPSILG